MLNLSLAARINSIKMNALPRFLYLFQCVPIFLPQTFFRKLDSIISDFVWSGRPPRLRKQYLQSPKKLGGMALPNFKFYYWAAHLKIIQFWLHSGSQLLSSVWLGMEHSSCKPFSLSALAHSPIKSPIKNYTKNVIIKTTVKIWNQFRRSFDLQTYSILAPITANHSFPPSLIGRAFEIWSNMGIKTFKDLYIDNTFASFEQLSKKFSLPNTFLGTCRSVILFFIGSLSFLLCPLTHPLIFFLNQLPL